MLDKIFKLEHQKLLSLVTSTAEQSLTEIIEQFKDFHYIEKYLIAENEWLVYKYEIEKGIFLDDFDETDKLETIQEIAHSKKYLHFEIEDLLNTIIALKINFLVRPNFTLEKFIFGNELTRIYTELFIKLKYFDYYDYLINGINETFNDIKDDHGAAYLTVTDFKNVSKNYDESYISELTPDQFAGIIKPLFELFTENDFDGISYKALKIFLEDKNLFEAAQQLVQVAQEKNLEFINESDFVEIIGQILDNDNPYDAVSDDNSAVNDSLNIDEVDEVNIDFGNEFNETIEETEITEDISPAAEIAQHFVDTSFTDEIPEIDDELMSEINENQEFSKDNSDINEAMESEEPELEDFIKEENVEEEIEGISENFEINNTGTDEISKDDFSIEVEIADEESAEDITNLESSEEIVIEESDNYAFIPDVNEENAETTSSLVLEETEEVTNEFDTSLAEIESEIEVSNPIDESQTEEEISEETVLESESIEDIATNEDIQNDEQNTDDNDFNEDEFDLDAFANSILSGETTATESSTSKSEITEINSTADNSEINSIIESIKSKINSNPSKAQNTKDASETKSQISSILSTFHNEEKEEHHDDFYSASYSDDILNDLNK